MEEIKNKVQESGLIQLDLADFKPKVEILEVDIAPQLWEGLILKEKDFRQWIKEHNWSYYENRFIGEFFFQFYRRKKPNCAIANNQKIYFFSKIHNQSIVHKGTKINCKTDF